MSNDNAADQVECMIAADKIAERVAQLGRQISTDYAGRKLIVVGVLKGAWVFMADLVRQLTIPVQCDFVRLSSYGMGTVSSGEPKLAAGTPVRVEGLEVLIVDDILDTGRSCQWLKGHFESEGAASVRLCVLLNKPARRQVEIQADYVGFDIPDHFVVGYGLDCAEQYRELPFVGFKPALDQ
jgi:hypoxanthine phosphoribosyltransferase